MKAFAPLCICLILCAFLCKAQDSILLVGKITRKYTEKVEQKASSVELGLDKQSEELLNRLQKQQRKVYAALLHKADSNTVSAFLNNSQQQYEAAIDKLRNKKDKLTKLSGSYIPGLDSMTNALKYMDKLPVSDKLPGKDKIASALAAGNKAGQSIAHAEEIKKLVRQQQEQLKALASRYKDLKITKQLKQYNKELYYYSQRVQQAKETLNDPAKVEQAVLGLLRKNAGFKNWMQQNGQLAQLFGGAGSGVANPTQTVAGLQTRQGVQQLVQSRLGGSLQQAQGLINSQVQQAQGQLSDMQNQLQQQISGRLNGAMNKLPGNKSGDMAMPDFKPNNQKIKPFLKRLEKGWNLQATQHRGMFPSVNELGTSVGYKLNDKKVIGVGMAYRFALGESIGKLHWTNEGISLRSYVDIKWKGNWWISGGYEQNYWSRFSSSQFRDLLWQSSALAGITKKITLKKNKEMKLQVLYDFLEKHVTGSPPIKFRVGKSF